jgi:hypothetical protein
MGGLVISSKDIDNLIKSCKSIRSKKEKLRNQIQYCKHFMNLNMEKSDILWQNTVNQMRSVLSSILNLDTPKVLEKGTWVAVSYEDNWYPGEITIKIDNTYTVKFLSRKGARGNTLIYRQLMRNLSYFMILKYCPHQTLDTGLFLKWMRLMMYMSSL